MSRKERTAAALVIGLGVLLQIPGHDAADMAEVEGMDHSAGAHERNATPDPSLTAARRTVTLDVTGMT
jgi:hypothetical protein